MAEFTFNGVPFEEAARFFRDKVRLPTKAWTDLKEGQHARAFVVAGATKDALLTDLQASIQSAIDNGTGLPQFRKDFDAIVAKHGWSGFTGDGSKRGRAWRARVIFETNMSTARAAGRWEQIQRVKRTRPWLRYVAILDSHVRPDHRRWHGTVLPVDDDWWDTHFPPNGWNCRCTVMSLSKAQLADFGYEPSNGPPLEQLVRRKDPWGDGVLALDRGIDPGFNYNVGQAHVGLAREIPDGYARTQAQWQPLEGGAYRASTPADYGDAAPLEPQPMPAPLGPRAAGKAELVDQVEAAIGGTEATLRTPDGVAVHVDAALLADHLPPSRSPFVPLLPDLIEQPQEVWLIFERNTETGQVALRRRHLKVYQPPGDPLPTLMVFQARGGQFEAWTFIPVDRASYLERQRRGFRLWPPAP
jgi:SPP1 gp7 family putative phage head morphogenesis protein